MILFRSSVGSAPRLYAACLPDAASAAAARNRLRKEPLSVLREWSNGAIWALPIAICRSASASAACWFRRRRACCSCSAWQATSKCQSLSWAGVRPGGGFLSAVVGPGKVPGGEALWGRRGLGLAGSRQEDVGLLGLGEEGGGSLRSNCLPRQ